MKQEKAHSTAPESKFATGSRSQGPRSNDGLRWSSRKTFITSPRSPLAEKANCELRKLMTLKLSIYLGLSPLCEMPQKVPVSFFPSARSHASAAPHGPGPGLGYQGNQTERTSFLLIQMAFLNPPCRGQSSPEFCFEV